MVICAAQKEHASNANPKHVLNQITPAGTILCFGRLEGRAGRVTRTMTPCFPSVASSIHATKDSPPAVSP